MTFAQLLLLIACVFAALDAFGARPWGRFSRLAAAICLIALAFAINGTSFNHQF